MCPILVVKPRDVKGFVCGACSEFVTKRHFPFHPFFAITASSISRSGLRSTTIFFNRGFSARSLLRFPRLAHLHPAVLSLFQSHQHAYAVPCTNLVVGAPSLASRKVIGFEKSQRGQDKSNSIGSTSNMRSSESFVNHLHDHSAH